MRTLMNRGINAAEKRVCRARKWVQHGGECHARVGGTTDVKTEEGARVGGCCKGSYPIACSLWMNATDTSVQCASQRAHANGECSACVDGAADVKADGERVLKDSADVLKAGKEAGCSLMQVESCSSGINVC